MIEVLPTLTKIASIVGGVAEVSRSINNITNPSESNNVVKQPELQVPVVTSKNTEVITKPRSVEQQRPLKVTVNVNFYINGEKQDIPGLYGSNVIDI